MTIKPRGDGLDYPCRSYVVDSDTGRPLYCEQGPQWHEGTCFGTKSQSRYNLEVNEVREARRAVVRTRRSL